MTPAWYFPLDPTWMAPRHFRLGNVELPISPGIPVWQGLLSRGNSGQTPSTQPRLSAHAPHSSHEWVLWCHLHPLRPPLPPLLWALRDHTPGCSQTPSFVCVPGFSCAWQPAWQALHTAKPPAALSRSGQHSRSIQGPMRPRPTCPRCVSNPYLKLQPLAVHNLAAFPA